MSSRATEAGEVDGVALSINHGEYLELLVAVALELSVGCVKYTFGGYYFWAGVGSLRRVWCSMKVRKNAYLHKFQNDAQT